jgi:hypothetical protein
VSGWAGYTERERMEEFLAEGREQDKEWGWYVDDVPVLLAEIDRLRVLLGLPRFDGEVS